MPTVLAIDPGTTQSAAVLWDGKVIMDKWIKPNDEVLYFLRFLHVITDVCIIEMIASYGMPVGKETFETVRWIGRFEQRCMDNDVRVDLVYRKDVKLHHCKSSKAKDANIWQALVDRFGAPGVKKSPGLLYGVTSHERAALALAVYYVDLMNETE